MAASYPTSSKSFSTKATTNVIEASHVNDIQDEVTAIETALLTGGLAHNVIPSGTRTLGNSSTFWDKGYLTALILGAETTSGVRLDVNAGVLEVLEGDDSAYGPLKALTLEATSNGVIGGTLGVTGATTLGDIATQSLIGSGANGVGIGATHASGTIRWYSGGTTERMRLHTNGRLAIGDTLGTASMLLHIIGAENANYVARFQNSHGSAPLGVHVFYSGAAPNGTGNQFFRAEDTGGTRAEIRSNGGLANYSANDVNLSDDSAKDYDAPLTDADIAGDVAAFLSLEIRRGKYKDAKDHRAHLMLSAQQVEATCPDWCGEFDAKKGLKGTREYLIQLAAYATIQQMAKRLAVLEAR